MPIRTASFQRAAAISGAISPPARSWSVARLAEKHLPLLSPHHQGRRGKFGKTEKGNIWLDPVRTSPYQFYQFWLNATDTDAEKWIRIFTFLSKDEIDFLIEQHKGNEHLRLLQKKLAEQVTIFVHGLDKFLKARSASDFIFSPDSNGNILDEV